MERLIDGAGDATATGDLFTWLDLLDVFVTSRAGAGGFDVAYEPLGIAIATDVTPKYYKWHEAALYPIAFQSQAKRLRVRYTDSSVFNYLNEVDEAFRDKAVEYARLISRDPIPHRKGQSTSRRRVLRQSIRDLLSQRASYAQAPWQSQVVSPRRTRKGPSRELKNDNIRTTAMLPDATRRCKPFNDASGCSQAACRGEHVCDAMMVNVKACGKSHMRNQHDSRRDGATSKLS